MLPEEQSKDMYAKHTGVGTIFGTVWLKPVLQQTIENGQAIRNKDNNTVSFADYLIILCFFKDLFRFLIFSVMHTL